MVLALRSSAVVPEVVSWRRVAVAVWNRPAHLVAVVLAVVVLVHQFCRKEPFSAANRIHRPHLKRIVPRSER